MKQSYCQKHIALGRILTDTVPHGFHIRKGIVNLLSEMIYMRLQAFIKHCLFMFIYDKLLQADIGSLLMMGMMGKYLLPEAGT